MLKGILHFFGGTVRLTCEKSRFPSLAENMAREGISYRSLAEKDGEVFFSVSELEYKKLKKTGELDGVSMLFRRGLPNFLHRYRRRYGLIVGVLIFVILTKMSTSYVWDITVEGNESVSDSEVISTLEKLGFSVGSHIPDIDFYNICHQFILENESVAWISVNMEGTAARVKLIERSPKGESGNNGTPSNIVANIDGIIVRTETVNGEVCVKAGDPVKEGQLLISGVVEVGQGENTGKFILTRSEGRVFALTNRVLNVEIPLNGVKSEIKERILAKKTLIFFGKSIKLQENSSILDKECDIIKESRRVVLFEKLSGGWQIPLPASMVLEYALIKEEKNYTLSESEALSLAEKEMASLYEAVLGSAELVKKTEVSVLQDGVLTLTWEIKCIEDIGRETPIGLV